MMVRYIIIIQYIHTPHILSDSKLITNLNGVFISSMQHHDVHWSLIITNTMFYWDK